MVKDNNVESVLVTGGAGYIGSHAVYALVAKGYRVIVLDLKKPVTPIASVVYIQGDCGDTALLSKIFLAYAICAVMHFAAFIEVGESVKEPLKYYHNNVAKTIVLLQAMIQHGISFFIFSSSCAVYGNPQKIPLTEEHPKNPISPYGATKQFIEQVLSDLDAAKELRFVALRYFNAAGALAEQGLGERHYPETHIIPLLLRAALHGTSFTIYGDDYPTADGTCMRDYLHVVDIAAAHFLALDYLLKGGFSDCFNLGVGKAYSVKEIVHTVERITGCSIECVIGTRRQGDPPVLCADFAKVKDKLDWHPDYSSLENMVTSAYAFELREQEGTF